MTTRADGRTVRDNPGELRYELLDGDAVVGFIRYRREPGAVALVHTDVDPDLEGTGAASELVEQALDDVRRHGLKVIPICPYVRSWIDRHPAYTDLVVEDPAPPE
jgi:predicted GNAT family acetyltransferase